MKKQIIMIVFALLLNECANASKKARDVYPMKHIRDHSMDTESLPNNPVDLLAQTMWDAQKNGARISFLGANSKTATFITLDEDGTPVSRNLTVHVDPEKKKLFIRTLPKSRKIAHLQSNPDSTLHFNFHGREKARQLQLKGHVVQAEPVKRTLISVSSKKDLAGLPSYYESALYEFKVDTAEYANVMWYTDNDDKVHAVVKRWELKRKNNDEWDKKALPPYVIGQGVTIKDIDTMLNEGISSTQ